MQEAHRLASLHGEICRKRCACSGAQCSVQFRPDERSCSHIISTQSTMSSSSTISTNSFCFANHFTRSIKDKQVLCTVVFQPIAIGKIKVYTLNKFFCQIQAETFQNCANCKHVTFLPSRIEQPMVKRFDFLVEISWFIVLVRLKCILLGYTKSPLKMLLPRKDFEGRFLQKQRKIITQSQGELGQKDNQKHGTSLCHKSPRVPVSIFLACFKNIFMISYLLQTLSYSKLIFIKILIIFIT